jgi:hypothetical protein
VVSVVVGGLDREGMRSEVERRWVRGRWGTGKPPRRVALGSCGLVGGSRKGLVLAAKGRKLGASSSSSSRLGLGGCEWTSLRSEGVLRWVDDGLARRAVNLDWATSSSESESCS